VKPPRYEPMLATPWPRPFSDEGWLFEPKWDGIRGIVHWDGSAIWIRTRRGTEVAERYPELCHLDGLPPCVFDGEIIAFDDEGRPSFERLQQRMHRHEGRGAEHGVGFIAFDLLYDGSPLLTAPVEERISRLEGVGLPPPYGTVAPRRGDGDALWGLVVERDLEGMVAKRVGSPYRPGARSPDWRKIHHLHRVKALVGGYTPGERGRSATFGALLLGLRDGDALRWIGAVGTGFSDAALVSIHDALVATGTDRMPFHPDREIPKAAWVDPRLVAVVEYRNWTAAGRLRRPVFKGFAEDDPDGITWEAEGPGGA
jgi:bifunctional non-homologous end joining protein LigD